MKILCINPPVLTVDPHQTCMYAESYPIGLVRIASWLRRQGHDVGFFDMMAYWDGDFEMSCRPQYLWGHKNAGDRSLAGFRLPVYLYGTPLKKLEQLLDKSCAFDEVYITSCMSYCHEVTFAVVRICRDRLPKSRIRLGGFYPSFFPDHAKLSGADEIFIGYHQGADALLPDPSIMNPLPPIWIFSLYRGCRYHCSYCANTQLGNGAVNTPAGAVEEIVHIHERYGIRAFSNWDPNIMLRLDLLNAFLDELIRRELPISIKFEMGIQPDLLTESMALKMHRAGCRSMTIPFESSEAQIMKRFGKPYTVQASLRAMEICTRVGFDTSRFHCPFVVGIRNEGFRHVFKTYALISKAGGFPTPFPLTVTPGTREWDLHKPFVEGKPLDELNGHLWPCLRSEEEVALYRSVLEIIRRPVDGKTEERADRLPAHVREAFYRYMDEEGARR